MLAFRKYSEDVKPVVGPVFGHDDITVRGLKTKLLFDAIHTSKVKANFY